MAKPVKTEAPAAPAVHTSKKSGRTVTVACKVQNGLILQLCKPTTWIEDTPSGPKERMRYDRYGRTVVVAGPAYPVMPPKGYPRQKPVEFGFALTHGVDADFFEEWVEQNKLNPIVESGAIYAHSSPVDVAAQGRELESMLTGFEPLDMDSKLPDVRLPRPQDANIIIDQRAA